MKKIHIQAHTPWLHLDFAELYHFRWVLLMLTLRDIKLRYKQTFLGVAWVILQPLLTALLFTAVFGKALHLPSEGTPYMLFAFCGLVPWLVFSQSLQRASPCLINDTRLITKVYFPRIFLPLSATFGVIIDFIIGLAMVTFLMMFNGYSFSSKIIFLPLLALHLFIFACGINLFFSSLSVYYRDFKHIVPFLIQLWMYASPLVYSSGVIPHQFQFFYNLNPMVGIIEGFRFCLLGTPFPGSFQISILTSVLLLISGTFIFRKIEHNFADVI
ncbi:MAG: Teichoic acid translocation permease protein TagG [Chlamydiae bacterium]|nr:Teichoic acid translocation permease protein TagG [Chlamydiota bacterium]